MTFASRRFTTKPGASAVSTAFLPSPRATTKAVESAASVVCGVLTISISGMTATGLKKWKPTSRSGCASFAPISSTDSDEVLVARIASSAMIFSISPNTCCLTPTSSKTASMTKSQSAYSRLVGRAVHERAQPVGGVAVEAALGLELADLVVDVRETLVDARLIEVGDEHRNLQLAQEQQRELARHQAGADDADLRDLLRERLVGRADRALGALLHEIERVHGCRELVAGDEIGQRVVFTGEALGLRAALRLVEQFERGVGRLGAPCRCGSRACRAPS